MSVCLYFVVPCYNDADTLPITVPVFLKKMDALLSAGKINADSRLLLVNDGSADDTWHTIVQLKKQESRIVAMNLAENAGEENALLAGMFTAVEAADCVITMDSDLQDDIHAVESMLLKHGEGYDIVCGVRSSRKEDTLAERLSAGLFYGLMRLAGTGMIAEHSNYRLMSQKAVEGLREYSLSHSNYYLPCLVSNMDFKKTIVYYERVKRTAGQSGYNFKKRLNLGVSALLLHSDFLLKLPLALAIIFCVLLLFGIIWAVSTGGWSAVFTGNNLIFECIALLFGVINFVLFARAKHRKKEKLKLKHPRYRIKEIID